VRLDRGDAVLDAGAEVVARHQLDERRAQHLLPVEAAAVEQHLAEADVVAHRAEGAGAAAVEGRRTLERRDPLRLAVDRVDGQRVGDARALRIAQPERRVVHPSAASRSCRRGGRRASCR
jgi:hypothetical protein